MIRIIRVLRRKKILINKRWFLFDTKTMTYTCITLKTMIKYFAGILASLLIVSVIFNIRGYNLGIENSDKNHKDSIEFYRKAYFQTKDSLIKKNVEYEMVKPKYSYHYIGNCTTKYDPIIKKASEIYDVPEAIIKAVIEVESGYNENTESPAGAKCLMQLMKCNYELLRINDPYNHTENIMAGTEFLKILYIRYGNWDDVFRFYNGGFRGVSDPHDETIEYVKKVYKRLEKKLNK